MPTLEEMNAWWQEAGNGAVPFWPAASPVAPSPLSLPAVDWARIGADLLWPSTPAAPEPPGTVGFGLQYGF